jgi:hypothetical protein
MAPGAPVTTADNLPAKIDPLGDNPAARLVADAMFEVTLQLDGGVTIGRMWCSLRPWFQAGRRQVIYLNPKERIDALFKSYQEVRDALAYSTVSSKVEIIFDNGDTEALAQWELRFFRG